MNNELVNNLNQLMNFGDGFFANFGEPFFTTDSSNNLKSDVITTKDGYQVTIDVPGVVKKDLALSYDQDILSVKVQRKSELDEKDEKQRVIARERSYGDYVRNYSLPDVDANKISAKMTDGVLTINLPKTAQKPTGHQIEIN